MAIHDFETGLDRSLEGTKKSMSLEDAIKYANEGLDSNDKNRIMESLAIFEQLLENDPFNHTVLFAIACCLMRIGKSQLAIHLFYRCLEIDPKMHESLNNIGFIHQIWGQHEKAREFFKKALALDSKAGSYYNNVATAYVNEGNPQLCLEWTAKCLERDPGNPEAMWNAGLAHLELGNWKEGWEGYEAGLVGRAQSSQNRKRRNYPGDIPYLKDKPEAKEVVIYGEQGVGDEILAASVLEEASKDYGLIYEAHPRLVSIMRHNFGHLFPIYGTRKTPADKIQFFPWHHIEAKAPIFSLLMNYRQKDADFPRKVYLKPFDNLVDKYREKLRKLGSRPKIGISWKGGSDTTRKDLRAISIEQFRPLFQSVDADWVSLQYDPADRMGWNAPIVKQFEEASGISLNHWPEVVNDLDECYAGLIHALDFVITINNSLTHACGAFGVPCWTLTPNKPAWRYNVPGAVSCGDDRMIWYADHVTQIRQEPEEEWANVIQRIAHMLPNCIDERTAA